ncbi:unnamed protein product [Ilex paraguariensis]|uniref:Phosphoribulokinase/uridine kinase domain-containing protein n=1 Tax=Ilex paraguariensis TaxID=185542 RepID=A0ABC8T4W0_9AQUA
MNASSFPTGSRGLYSPPSETVVLKRMSLAVLYRGSVSNLPIKRFSQTSLDRPRFLIRKENCVQVLCGRKREIPVLEAGCMDDVYNALAERLVRTAAASNFHFKHIVGLAGTPGSGKSTLAFEVARRVNTLWPQKSFLLDSSVEPPDVALVLPMDGFHLYRHQLDAMEDPEEAYARRGAPWTFDPELLLRCLRTLRNEGSVYAPSFDHGVGDPVEDDIFVNFQHKVVIVEGNYLLLEEGSWKEISYLFDDKWDGIGLSLGKNSLAHPDPRLGVWVVSTSDLFTWEGSLLDFQVH